MTNIQCQTLQQRHIEAPRVFARVFDGIVAGLSRLPRTLVETLLSWQRRADERGRLATLDPRLLSDMGISEAAAAREAAIPFWRLK
jgi:uncharacterized protein YjiS (DUF1127 family)